METKLTGSGVVLIFGPFLTLKHVKPHSPGKTSLVNYMYVILWTEKWGRNGLWSEMRQGSETELCICEYIEN